MDNKQLINQDFQQGRLQALKDVLVKSFDISEDNAFLLRVILHSTLDMIFKNDDINYKNSYYKYEEKFNEYVGWFTQVLLRTTTKSKEQTYEVLSMFIKFVDTCEKLKRNGMENVLKNVIENMKGVE